MFIFAYMYNDIYYDLVSDKVYEIPYGLPDEEKINYFKRFRKELTTKMVLNIIKKYNKNYSSGDSRLLSINNICNIFKNIYTKDELQIDLEKKELLYLLTNFKWDCILFLKTFSQEKKIYFTEEETLEIFNNISKAFNNLGSFVKSIEPYIEDPLFCGEDSYHAENIEDLLKCRSYLITKLLEDDI